jgi:hypothetical protein
VQRIAIHRHISAKSTLGWGALFFVLTQIALNVYLDVWHPEQYDGEFDIRLSLLQERIAENPGQPLLLLVGSSRMTMNYLPEQLPPLYTPAGQRVLPFNFAHLGAGPAMNLLEVRRLLRAGTRPDWLIVEIMPPQLNDDKQRILHDMAAAGDLPMVFRHKNLFASLGLYARTRVAPCYRQRAYLVRCLLPQWPSPDDKPIRDTVPLGPLGGDYEWWAVSKPDAKDVEMRTFHTKAGYFPPLQEGFRIAELSDSTMRELLDLCRSEGIAVVLLLSPEGPTFRSWYCAPARKLIDEYSATLSRDYGLPLIDARDWLDEADFIDSHHTTLEGAHRFTHRLGSDVLVPLVAGKLR